MPSPDPFAQLDATAQAGLVRTGQVRPEELLEAALSRVARVDPALNAVVARLEESARAQLAEGLPDGPFRGVPFLLKDLLSSLRGSATGGGSRFFADAIAPHDSELVARHKRAGLVIFGKTATPELGLLPTTESKVHGPTRNPWDEARSPGGSSGGAAAAVAARLVPLAHASDGGGSIRIPASCCGVFGLKPTRGRNPLGPDIGEIMHGFVVEHAISLSVRDSAALLDATEGPDPGAPYIAPPKRRPYLEELQRPPRPLRIRFTTAPVSPVEVAPACVAAVEDAALLLESLGHRVEEGSLLVPTQPLVAPSFLTLWASGAVLPIDGLGMMMGKEPSPELFEETTWALYQTGRAEELSTYLVSVAILQRFSREIAAHFQQVDLWLTPTTAEPAPPLGTFEPPPGDPLAPLRRATSFASFTALANVTGQPAMSVPLYWTPEGLPVGVQLIGHFGDEGTLFALAGQLEQARPWKDRVPRVSALGAP